MGQPVTRRVASVALLSFLATAFPDAILGEAPQTIKIAVLPSDSVSLAYYALDRGSFKKEGFDAILIPLQSGPAIAAAVASGAADFGAANIIALAVAHEKGIPFAAIAPAGVYNGRSPSAALVVARSSNIRSAKDLDGRVVGVDSLKTLGSIATSAWVDRNGGHSGTLQFVELPFGEMGVALAAGRIDAAFLPEPVLGRVLATDGRMLASALDAISPELQLGAWFTTPQFAKLHPEIIQAFRAIMLENANWSKANQGVATTIYEQYTRSQVTEQTRRMGQSGTVRLEEIQPLIDAAAKYGVLARPFPGSELFDPIALGR